MFDFLLHCELMRYLVEQPRPMALLLQSFSIKEHILKMTCILKSFSYSIQEHILISNYIYLFYPLSSSAMKKIVSIFLVVVLISWCTLDQQYKVIEDSESTGIVKNVDSIQFMVKDLQYLIQEEKLARDVYLEMYKLRWHKKFYNIINSEENHQNQVAIILEKYDIDNPIQWLDSGEYVDKELTVLYKQLISSGSLSLQEAMKVWVAIETMDIDDIEKMMGKYEAYPDIKSMLQSLLDWSRRHLSAFNR